ncbi:MAG: hypothetical protein GWO38_30640 [Phycisphaerae bacterium]|nr:hypothetical protein [Phycisphaerae bacterium]NIX02639.1 hypothetical protein [Phycisphaerae bacterium]NIX31866.1 hypothetical protein [Phycisphaerae bacterium]
MPKPKPDEVIRHEIVLGRSERELLDTLVTANAATKVVVQPLVSMLSEPQALIALFAILEGLGITDFIPPNVLQLLKDGAYESFEDFEEAAVNALEDSAESLTKLVRYMPIYRSYYYIKKATEAI